MPLVFFNMLWEIGTLGLLNLTSHLESKGYSIKLVYLPKLKQEGYPNKHAYPLNHNLLTSEELGTILNFVEQEKPQLVGFSLMTYDFDRTRQISSELKKRFPQLPIVWGGIHPTFVPEESIRYADYVCVGEGEDAIVDLVRAIEFGSPTRTIKNIWSKHNCQVYRNDVRPLIQNLDDYPFPRFNWGNTYCLDNGRIVQLTHELYRKNVLHSGTTYDIMASRGCPLACSYCCNALYRKIYTNKGMYVRYRSVDNVIEELLYAKKEFPYISMVNVQDDAFASAPEPYLKEFSEKYKKKIGFPLKLRIVPTTFTEKKAEFLSNANTLVGVIGIQSSDRINNEIFNRQISSGKIIDVARMLKRRNIVGQYDLIVRNPYETEKDMVEICRILSRIPKPYQLGINPMAFFPNTPLKARAVSDGIKVNESDGYETGFGSYPMRYPYLFRLQEACPYTPGFLIAFFLYNRHSPVARCIFFLYYYSIVKGIDKVREKIMRNTKLVDWIKNLVFLRHSRANGTSP
jgi:anaerobic magnesium-protoporphyrin IX monomethyl ester cyclase